MNFTPDYSYLQVIFASGFFLLRNDVFLLTGVHRSEGGGTVGAVSGINVAHSPTLPSNQVSRFVAYNIASWDALIDEY